MSKYPEVKIPAPEAWAKAAAKSAPDGDVTKLNWNTPEGLVVKPLYTKADVADLPCPGSRIGEWRAGRSGTSGTCLIYYRIA